MGIYLALLSMARRKRVNFFNDVKLRILSNISSWKGKLFSNGGKETLTKAMAEGAPEYAMSVFVIPLGLCDDIQKAFANYLRPAKKDHVTIRWARCERLFKAKSRVGMGFRDLSSFNQALVVKQG